MKNESEKEIEHVKPFNRYNGGCFKQRDKARQQIVEQQNANISISWLRRKKGRYGNVQNYWREIPYYQQAEKFPPHYKEKEAKEKKWNWKN